MTYQVFVLPSAKNDLLEAKSFYDAASPGLGRYCVDSLVADMSSLSFCAGIHSKHYGYFRLLSRRFPYAIYYEIAQQDVAVVAVLSTRRNPNSHSMRLV